MKGQNGRLQSVAWLTCTCAHLYSWRSPAL